MTIAKARDIAYPLYRQLIGAPGKRFVVIVNTENEVYMKPDFAKVVGEYESKSPKRIAGYYVTARNLRALGVTPDSIAADIMAVVEAA